MAAVDNEYIWLGHEPPTPWTITLCHRDRLSQDYLHIPVAQEMLNVITENLIPNTRDRRSGEKMKPRQSKEIHPHFTMPCCHLIYYHMLLLSSQWFSEMWLFPAPLCQQIVDLH